MKKRKLKKSLKTVPSWFILFGTLFCVFFAFGILRLYTDKEIIGIPEETVQDIIKKYK